MIHAQKIDCLLVRAAGAMQLDRWTWYVAIGAEHATVAFLGLEQGMAGCAFVEPLAGIRGHGFLLSMAAVRAGDRGVGDVISLHLDVPFASKCTRLVWETDWRGGGVASRLLGRQRGVTLCVASVFSVWTRLLTVPYAITMVRDPSTWACPAGRCEESLERGRYANDQSVDSQAA